MSNEDRESNGCEPPGRGWDVEGHFVPPVPENLAEVAALKSEIEELQALAVRSTAEAEIARQRAERAVVDAREFGFTKFALDILLMSDNLRRAIAAIDTMRNETKQNDPLGNGVRATERILVSVLEKFKIQKMETLGSRYDPNCQEAVQQVKDDNHSPGPVVQVLEDGYTIGGRLLRPARVVIAARGGDREYRSV